MRTGIKQFLVIAGAAGLIVLLYFAPQKVKKEKEEKVEPFSFKTILTEAKGSLKRQEAERISSIESVYLKDTNSVVLLDSLGKAWDAVNMPQISAHYFELLAERKPDERNWINAAFRYYDAFRISGDSMFRKMNVDKAIASYKKVLEINPKNLDAKTDLGICYAEGTNSPMQGIMMLREVVQENPKHEMALFNLGVLSIKSAQYDKAVDRFEKVLELNPNNKEARFLLGRTYISMGKSDLALKNLQMIRNTSDSEFNNEVNNLISKINNQ
jgi:tetratricopeptide (TPR) repeat protein